MMVWHWTRMTRTMILGLNPPAKDPQEFRSPVDPCGKVRDVSLKVSGSWIWSQSQHVGVNPTVCGDMYVTMMLTWSSTKYPWSLGSICRITNLHPLYSLVSTQHFIFCSKPGLHAISFIYLEKDPCRLKKILRESPSYRAGDLLPRYP